MKGDCTEICPRVEKQALLCGRTLGVLGICPKYRIVDSVRGFVGLDVPVLISIFHRNKQWLIDIQLSRVLTVIEPCFDFLNLFLPVPTPHNREVKADSNAP